MLSIKSISKLQSLLAPLLLDWTWGLNFWFYQPFLRFNKIQHVHNKNMTHKNATRILTAMSLCSLPMHDIHIWQTRFVCRVSDYSEIRVVSSVSHRSRTKFHRFWIYFIILRPSIVNVEMYTRSPVFLFRTRSNVFMSLL